MRKLVYLPLEPYVERYTYQLQIWNETRFKQRGINFISVEGDKLRDDMKIGAGQVLDAHGRSYWSLTQMARVVKLMHDGEINNEDVIFSEDLFHPGYESLPYIMFQIPENQRPKVYTRNLAQSIDPNDFVYPIRHWMRDFENMVDKTITGIFMANTAMGPFMRTALFNAPLYVTGLPFDKDEVRSRVPSYKPLNQRSKRIIFSSRWAYEKQPDFFMNMIEQSGLVDEGYEFAILQGSPTLRGPDKFVKRAYDMQERGLLKVYVSLSKDKYYEILADSLVQFNCALQDWQSNTLNEASALGTLSLCPGYLSFPEALNNNSKHLYTPWVIEDAIYKLRNLLGTLDDSDVSYAADDQHKTIDRTIDIMLGKGEQYRWERGW